MVAGVPLSASRPVDARRGHSRRLDFLDAARAVAALMVLAEHCLEQGGVISNGPGGFSTQVLDFGQAGVMAFFLVSGFVIPVSLERKGNLSSFWVSRVCRLYPMYVIAWILGAVFSFRELVGFGYVKNLLAHIVFVQELTGQRGVDVVDGSWTLSLEMIWYMLFSALFWLGGNKKTGRVVLLAILTVIALMVGSLVFGRSLPFGRLGLMLGFFAGLVVYRHFEGRCPTRQAALLIAGIVATSAAAAYVRFQLLVPPNRAFEFSSSAILASWGLGYAVFFLFYIFREGLHPVTAALAKVGTVSYSVYLLHPFLMRTGTALGISGLALLPFVAVMTVLCSAVTYRLVELPFIRLGHRIGSLQRTQLEASVP